MERERAGYWNAVGLALMGSGALSVLASIGARVVTVLDLTLRKVPWTMRRETLRELGEKLEVRFGNVAK